MTTRKSWTREESIIVFNLYCKIPFKNSSKMHPEVIKIANMIGRTPSAVNMKIGNFGSFDENLRSQGIVGLTNASKLDKEIWDEFNGNWDKLAYESELLIKKYDKSEIAADSFPLGAEKDVVVKQRVNQNFFRKSILASYNKCCCITGINTEALLNASHIKPWKDCTADEKTNPQNGLCLNALHDRAFDRGFITITPQYHIYISKEINDEYSGKAVENFFGIFNGKMITLPEKFLPKKDFLQYHNDVIFESWR